MIIRNKRYCAFVAWFLNWDLICFFCGRGRGWRCLWQIFRLRDPHYVYPCTYPLGCWAGVRHHFGAWRGCPRTYRNVELCGAQLPRALNCTTMWLPSLKRTVPMALTVSELLLCVWGSILFRSCVEHQRYIHEPQFFLGFLNVVELVAHVCGFLAVCFSPCFASHDAQ